MYKGKKVSLVFPAYNEEPNIAVAIVEFRKLHVIDEIIVVDNNSKDRTAIIAKRKKVKLIKEKKQGYGYALRKGISIAKGEYILLCEPDSTFKAKDALRLLNNILCYDAVIGTRTNKKYIHRKANMHGALRLGNVLLARFIQILYRPLTQLTDCGCTFRVIRKPLVKKILPKLTVGSSHFLSELLVLILLENSRVLEIPVTYRQRVGESKITGSMKKSIIVGFKMLIVVLKYRF